MPDDIFWEENQNSSLPEASERIISIMNAYKEQDEELKKLNTAITVINNCLFSESKTIILILELKEDPWSRKFILAVTKL